MTRRLSPDERAVWSRVTATAKPNKPASRHEEVLANPPPVLKHSRQPAVLIHPVAAPRVAGLRQANTLDATWDKRIAKGTLQPDFTIDLHGNTLSSAHASLNRSLSAAIRAEARVVLLITGKASLDNPRLPPTSRGVIRASVKDWLAHSTHSGHIAAIRGAHPRHGGAGALYVVLRRAR